MLGNSFERKKIKYGPRRPQRQVRFRLAEEIFVALEKQANSQKVSVNYLLGSIVEEAFSKNRPDSAWDTGLKLLSEVRARQKTMSSDFECMFETICFFIYQWFCHTTPLPDSQRRGASIDGKIRFEKFLELVRQKLNEGRSPFSRLLEGDGDDKPPTEETPDVANSG